MTQNKFSPNKSFEYLYPNLKITNAAITQEEFIIKEEHAQYYYKSEYVSQSKLKTLLVDPKLFHQVKEHSLYFEEKEHFLIGSGVDFLCSYNKELFTQKYYVSTIINKPTDAIKSIINYIYDNIDSIVCFESFKALIIESCVYHNYSSNFKDETKIAKLFEKNNIEYLIDLIKGENKIVLSLEEANTIDTIYDSMRENKYVNEYFDEDKYTIFNQVAIYFNYNGVKCKSLLDRICIDTTNRTIQVIDFKTTGDYTSSFPKSFRKFRYDLQAAFYTIAIKNFIDLLDLEWYKILPFKFIVQSTIRNEEPIMYDFDNCYDEENICNLVEDYKYYVENGFSTSKNIKENDYCLKLEPITRNF